MFLREKSAFARAGVDAAGVLQEPRQLHREPRQRLPLAGHAGRSRRRGDLPGLRRGRSALRRRGLACSGVGHRRHGHRQGRREDRSLPAGHGAARQVHALRRRLPRPPRQGSSRRASSCARAWRPRSTASASRSCGRWRPTGTCPGSSCTPPAGRCRPTPTAARSSTTWRTTRSRVGFVVGLGLPQPVPLARSRNSSATRRIPTIRGTFEGGTARRFLRRARHHRRRPAVAAEARLFPAARWSARRGLPQRLAHQGQPRRHQVRHARRGKRVRRARRRPPARRAHAYPEAFKASWLHDELHQARNFKPWMSKGLLHRHVHGGHRPGGLPRQGALDAAPITMPTTRR